MKRNKSINTSEQKKTRGYRLKPSTHGMIAKLQRILNCDQDKAIADACLKLYKEIKTMNGSAKAA